MRISKVIYHIILPFTILFMLSISVLNWKGKVLFGLGMGDMVYLLATVISIIILLVLYLKSLKSKANQLTGPQRILVIACLIIITIISLKITIMRGPAAPWDGTIFF